MKTSIINLTFLAALLVLVSCQSTATTEPRSIDRKNQTSAHDADSATQDKNSETTARVTIIFPDGTSAVTNPDTKKSEKKLIIPRLKFQVQPKYPPTALAAGKPASIKVEIVVGKNGKVEAARILESSDAKFDSYAIEAVKQWEFVPATVEGKPVLFRMVVPIVFRAK